MKTSKASDEGLLAPFKHRSKLVAIGLVLLIQLTMIIVIPIVYSVGREQASTTTTTTVNTTAIGTDFIWNECTVLTDRIDTLFYLSNEEPFPYRTIELLYRPRVVTRSIEIYFGFRHDQKTWAFDKVEFAEQTEQVNRFRDGDFESNYLSKDGNYRQCILSNSRSSTSDILFDLPYSGDFYYNDQTITGMNYLSQTVEVTGGKYYQLRFALENRGYSPNLFLVLIRH